MNSVEVRNLSYAYPDGTPALREVSFTVQCGERVALIGPNGAGKSTLLLHLNGLLPEKPAVHPSVKVFDLPGSAENLPRIRALVGLLFQDPNDQLFCPTVGEDAAFGPRQLGLTEPEREERVRKSLSETGLTGYENRAPHHLSRGEKRRACLAGVLACSAQVLALDEPTSDLDPRGRRELKQLLGRLSATQIIATHDLDLAGEFCSRVILLDKGEVMADGPARDVLSDETLMGLHGLEVPHILRHLHPHC